MIETKEITDESQKKNIVTSECVFVFSGDLCESSLLSRSRLCRYISRQGAHINPAHTINMNHSGQTILLVCDNHIDQPNVIITQFIFKRFSDRLSVLHPRRLVHFHIRHTSDTSNQHHTSLCHTLKYRRISSWPYIIKFPIFLHFL